MKQGISFGQKQSFLQKKILRPETFSCSAASNRCKKQTNHSNEDSDLQEGGLCGYAKACGKSSSRRYGCISGTDGSEFAFHVQGSPWNIKK